MKRIYLALILMFTMLFSLAIPCFASDTGEKAYSVEEKQLIEYIPLENGGYITIELYTPYAVSAKASAYTKTGSKFITEYDSDDEIVWKYTLTGTFSVNTGVSATCTDATYSTVVNDSAWSFSDCTATKSGNTAFGLGTVKHKRLWLFVDETVDIDISITCSVNGVLS